MKAFLQLLKRPITSKQADIQWITRVMPVFAVLVFGFTVVAAYRHATTTGEGWLVCGMGLLTAVSASAMGTLAARLEQRLADHPLPYRERWLEFTSYLLGLFCLTGGFWSLTGIPLTRGQVVMAVLGVLSFSILVIGVGMLATLRRRVTTLQLTQSTPPAP